MPRNPAQALAGIAVAAWPADSPAPGESLTRRLRVWATCHEQRGCLTGSFTLFRGCADNENTGLQAPSASPRLGTRQRMCLLALQPGPGLNCVACWQTSPWLTVPCIWEGPRTHLAVLWPNKRRLRRPVLPAPRPAHRSAAIRLGRGHAMWHLSRSSFPCMRPAHRAKPGPQIGSVCPESWLSRSRITKSATPRRHSGRAAAPGASPGPPSPSRSRSSHAASRSTALGSGPRLSRSEVPGGRHRGALGGRPDVPEPR